jgi:hypothetical protein
LENKRISLFSEREGQLDSKSEIEDKEKKGGETKIPEKIPIKNPFKEKEPIPALIQKLMH